MKKKHLIIAVITPIVVIGAFFIWPKPVSKALPLTQVSLQALAIKNIPIQVSALGNLTTPEGAMLKTEAAGVITKIMFKNGQSVKKGELLVQLDDASQRASYQNAEAALFQAQSEYDRYMQLNKEDPAVLSGLQIDQEYAAYKEAEANLAIQKKALDQMQIRAPFAGTLGSTTLSVGSYVHVGDPVVALVDLSNLVVVYSLPENDYSKVAPGEAVSLKAASNPGKTFAATVVYRAPLVDSTSHAFTVRAKLLHPEGLSPGMLMQVTQTLQEHHPVLAVPTISLISNVSGFAVYQVKDGKVMEQYVTVGTQYGDDTEIVSGLQAGDQIIVDGASKVQPGQAVEVKMATS